MIWNEEAVNYLRKHRAYVLRDLDALRSGQIEISDGGVDATAAWISRHERQIVHLDAIISSYEAATS